jgi:hypothetical protein
MLFEGGLEVGGGVGGFVRGLERGKVVANFSRGRKVKAFKTDNAPQILHL